MFRGVALSSMILNRSSTAGRAPIRDALHRDRRTDFRKALEPIDGYRKLALEDGTVFTGTAFGARGESDGEVVFNTSMTGYQEILTDPSYHGQIVTMTCPQIGNYGVNDEDAESSRPWVRGFVVREISRPVSN